MIDYPDKQVPAPADVVDLYNKAPKLKTGWARGLFPDARTKSGKAFYARQRQIEAEGGELGVSEIWDH